MITPNSTHTEISQDEKAAMSQGHEVPCLAGFVAKTYRSVDEIPRKAADAFLREHIAAQVAVYERENGVLVDGSPHAEGFWTHIDRVLPPHGSYYLIWTSDGHLAGTGVLRRVDETAGEMKNLYVRASARGTGLGRWLVEQRIRDARAAGLSHLMADTVRGNVEMPALYTKLGFEETEPNALGASVNATPEIAAGMRYFKMKL